MLPDGLAVCSHKLGGQMPERAFHQPFAVARSTSPRPQKAFKPRRRLPGRQGLGSCLQQLNQQAVGTLAFALEICPVTGRYCFQSRDLRLQRHEPGG